MNTRNECNFFTCPDCGQNFKSFPEEIGQEMSCPNCMAEFRIPNNLPETGTQKETREENPPPPQNHGDDEKKGSSLPFTLKSLDDRPDFQESPAENPNSESGEADLLGLETRSIPIRIQRNEDAPPNTDLAEEESPKVIDIYTFSCPKCNQNYSAEAAFVGLEIECSECGSEFQIPGGNKSHAEISRKEFDKTATVISSVKATRLENQQINSLLIESFDQDELSLIEDAMEIPLDSLRELKVEDCWEYGIVAELLTKRLAPLRDLISTKNREKEIKKAWGAKRLRFKKIVKNYFNEIFKLWHSLYNLMVKELNKVLSCKDIHAIFLFSEKMNLLTNDLIEIHEKIDNESIPNEANYIELHELMRSWVPSCYESLVLLTDTLRRNSHRSRRYKGIHPQISLIPTNLYRFTSKARELGLGFKFRAPIIAPN